MDSDIKRLTIIICTYNRAKCLESALKSLIKQFGNSNYFEIIVIDNNSQDDTKNIIKKYLNKLSFLKYIFEPKQGLSYARNRGIKEANSEYIAFLDDDAITCPNWVKLAYEIIDFKKPDIFGGPMYPYYEDKKPKWYKDDYAIRKVTNKPRLLKSSEFITAANIFYKKDIFNKIGLFDVDLGMKGNKVSLGEETQIQLKADKQGYKIFYHPNLYINHLVPRFKMRVLYILKRYYAYGYTRRWSNYKKDNIFFAFAMFIYSILLGLLRLILYPIRNKTKYPYWQNYFIDKFKSVFIFGALIFSYIKPPK